MMDSLIWLGTLLLVMGLAYWQAKRLIWIPVLGVWLLVVSLITSHLAAPPIVSLMLWWALYLIASMVFTCRWLRCRLGVAKIYDSLHDLLPVMSQTEKEALDAGDVWWEKQLFCGRPHWPDLLANPKPTLTPEEQAFIDNEVEGLCKLINDWQIIHEDKAIPEAILDYIKTHGFWGLAIPTQHGGRGFSALAQSNIVIKVATVSISVAVTVMVPNSLGPGELIAHYGTAEQQRDYLPKLAKGEMIPCFALTSAEAGSDAAAMTDRGIICKQDVAGESVLGIKLTWNKRYITLAPIATLLGLAVKLTDPEHLLGDDENLGITCCLVPTDLPGVDVGARHYPMGMAFPNGPTRGSDVFVPLTAVIGGQEGIGQGWKMLMESLSAGRGISMPALGTAGAKFCYRMTPAYAEVRKQFRTPIAQFEGIQEVLGRIAGYTYMMEATRLLTVGAIDQGLKPAVVTAITKYHLTELNRQLLTDAMDVYSGKGIQLGPKNYLAAAYIAAPIGITVEGANILTRNLIIFGQGAIRCHPYAYQEMLAAYNDDRKQGLKQFDRLLCRHLGYKLSNYVRSLWFGLTAGRLTRAPVTGSTAKYYRQLTRMSAALALTSDMAMLILGGALKRKERLSARLGDVLSHLYMASATLKYYNDQGSPAEDLPAVAWSVKTALHNIQLAFDDFFTNFPYPILARILKRLIFPWGQSYHAPSDRLEATLVRQMSTPSEFRDRLTQYCYLGSSEREPVWQTEQAFQKVLAAQAAERQLNRGIRGGKITKEAALADQITEGMQCGLLTADDEKTLLAAAEARAEVIQVDEFPPGSL